MRGVWLLGLLLIVWGGIVEGRVKGNAAYRFKETIFSRSSMDVASVDIDFEEDLYLSSFRTCPEFTKKQITKAADELKCLPCNYNVPNCSTTGPGHLSSVNGRELNEELENCECFGDGCSLEGLVEGQWKTHLAQARHSEFYRIPIDNISVGIAVEFERNSFNPPMVALKLTPISDDFSDFIGVISPQAYRNVMTVCPEMIHSQGITSQIYLMIVGPLVPVNVSVRFTTLPILDDPPILSFPPRNEEEVEGSLGIADVQDFKDGVIDFTAPPEDREDSYFIYPMKLSEGCHKISIQEENLTPGTIFVTRPSMYTLITSLEKLEGFLDDLRTNRVLVGGRSPFSGGGRIARAFEGSSLWTEALSYPFGTGGFVLNPCVEEDSDENLLVIIFPENALTQFLGRFIFREVSEDSEGLITKPISSFTEMDLQSAIFDSFVLDCGCNPDCEGECNGSNPERCPLVGVTAEFPVRTEKEECANIASLGLSTSDTISLKCETTSDLRTKACDIMQLTSKRQKYGPAFLSIPSVMLFFQEFAIPDDFFAVEPAPVHSNALNFLFHLKLTRRQKDYQIMFREDFKQCSIRFVGDLLHTKSGQPITKENFPLVPQPKLGCDNVAFNDIAGKAWEYAFRLQTATTGLAESFEFDRPSSLLFKIASILLTDTFQDCHEITESFLERELVEYIDNSTDCVDPDDKNDPCCSREAEWESCCLPKAVDAEENSIVGYTVDSVEETCAEPLCVAFFLDDLQAANIRSRTYQFCEAELDLQTHVPALQKCRDEWIGDDEKGYPCTSDQDCVDKFGSGECNYLCESPFTRKTQHLNSSDCLVQGRCHGPKLRKKMETEFLGCLLGELPVVIRSLLFRKVAFELVGNRSQYKYPELKIIDELEVFSYQMFGRTLSGEEVDKELLEEFQGKLEDLTPEEVNDYFYEFFTDALQLFLKTSAPISEYGPMSCKSKYYSMTIPDKTQTCGVCEDLNCLMESVCEFPPQCLDPSDFCFPTSLLFSKNCREEVCDWDRTITETACEEENKCIYCMAPDNCYTFPFDNEEECENHKACVTREGAIFTRHKDEECPIWNGDEGEAGVRQHCEDSERLIESLNDLENSILFKDKDNMSVFNFTEAGGVCFVPKKPYNLPGCSWLDENTAVDFSTSRGCARIGRCSSTNLSACEHTYNSPEKCSEINGEWFPIPIESKEQCIGKPTCIDPDDELRYQTFQPADSEIQCEQCGTGVRETGVWRTYKVEEKEKRLEWRKGRMVKQWEIADTINFERLESVLRTETGNFHATKYFESFQCFYQPEFVTTLVSACSCNGDPEDVDTCASFEDLTTEQSISTLLFCPEEMFSSTIGSLVIRSLPLSNFPICFNASFDIVFASRYTGVHQRKPATTFGDPNVLVSDPVRNSAGLSVGRVIGDGIDVSFFRETQQGDSYCEFQLIARPPLGSVSAFLEGANYPVIDFAREVLPSERRFPNEIELRPLGLLSVPVEDYFEDNSALIAIVPCYLVPNVSEIIIYPVARYEDYEDVQRESVLTENEEIMFYVFSALYGFAALIVLVFFVIAFVIMKITNICIMGFALLLLVTRSIFIGLFASDVEYQTYNTETIVMLELPSFFYMSFASVFVMVFSFAYLKIKDASSLGKKTRILWLCWWTGQVVLYAVAAVVVVLMLELPEGDTYEKGCLGRTTAVNQDDTFEVIRLSYHSFLLFVALVGSLTIFGLGMKIYSVFKSKNLLFFFICTIVGLMTQNIFWVVVSALSVNDGPYLVSILFLTEAIPILIVTFLLKPPQLKREFYMRKSSLSNFLNTSKSQDISG